MTRGWEADALLRELVQAWSAFDDDAVGNWERKMQDAVDAAKEYLNPRLEVDTDPAPAPRCIPGPKLHQALGICWCGASHPMLEAIELNS